MFIACCLGVGLTGCPPDPRISLNDFLAMQDQASAAAVPDTPVVTSVDANLPDYKIGSADVLTVTLTGLNEPAVSTGYRVRVNSEGTIDLPLAGMVHVARLDESEAEAAIKRAYVPGIVRQLAVNVEVIEFETTDVVVSGAVTFPGLVTLQRTQRNLLYAVLSAGGVSSSASGYVSLRRVRRPSERVSYDLTDPVQLEAALAIDPLEDGDMVMVEAAAPNTIFVGGLVNRPASQVYPPGVKMNILQALAAAGGVRTDVFPREGTLIRPMPNGEDVHVKLNLSRIASGQDDNVLLAAGDILWIPETVETRVQDFINKNIFLRAGFTATVSYNVSGLDFLNGNSRASRLRGLGGGGGLQDSFDPFGFLSRNTALQTLTR
jgi:polysaccharide biosynthesis/export protein